MLAIAGDFRHVARPYVEPRDLEHEEEARMAGDTA